jgi:serine/threonine-protein kinase HipA
VHDAVSDGKFAPQAPDLNESFFGGHRAPFRRSGTRIVFSYAFSNGDAHLKNFSLFQTGTTGDYVLTPAYDLVSTSVHVPDESRLALDVFADDFETRSFRDNGFATGACFLELARRFEIADGRARVLLAPFVEGPRLDVEDLITRSFLTAKARADYTTRYRDRLKALRLGS